MEETTFEEWCIVELMGHRRLAARVSERQLAGRGFLQLDIPDDQGRFSTSLQNPDSIYAIHPVSEEVARKVAAQTIHSPVSPHELKTMLKAAQRSLPVHSDIEDDDEEEEW